MERRSPLAPSLIPAETRSELTTNVSLVGMPGSGKTTVGRAVADRLGLRYVDSDRAIELRAGCSIAALFEERGEAAFRQLESAVLRDLVSASGTLIATGGGAVLREENRELLRTRTQCVYLRASHDLLWRRLRRDRRRPLLRVADPEARVREMHAERAPLYEDAATIVIDTMSLSFDRVVDAVVHRVSTAPSP
jgi:shikimate kinase